MPEEPVAIIEDHLLVRQGLEGLVRQRPDLELAWSGDSVEDLLSSGVDVRLTLLDLDLNGESPPLHLVAELIDRGSAVLVVSAMGAPAVVRQMLGVGVAGFVAKQDSTTDLGEAIEVVLGGGTWTTPELAAVMAECEEPEGVSLSDQERRVLVLYASGLKMSSVARRLDISPHTANTYLRRIRAKFADAGRTANTKTDLVREALHDGLLDQ